jgi:hypothetical protein
MPETNTRIVREFLEANNFTVFENRKFQLQKADPPGRHSIDILGTNLQYTKPGAPLPMRLQADHMRFIPNVIVDVKGWHSSKFSPSRISGSSELFHFVSPQALEFARGMFGGAPFKSVLVISEISAVEPLWHKTEQLLRERGVDHILEFSVILSFLISHVEINANYVGSDTLQLLRLLKRYGLVKSIQMELPFRTGGPNTEDED